MKLSKQVRKWYAMYAVIFGYIALIVGALVLLFFQLNNPKGLSYDELNAINSAHSVRQIIDNPINAPYKLLHLVLNAFNVTDLYRLRAISALFGLVTVTLLYFLIRSILSAKTAALAILLALCSSWFLQYSRVAVPDISIALALVTIPSIGLWLQRAKHMNWVFMFGIILFGLFLYIPSMILLLPLLLLATQQQLKQVTQGVSKLMYAAGVFLLILLLVPLVRSVVINPRLILELIGLPISFQPLELLKNIAIVPLSLFAYGFKNPAYNLGSLPLLDVFSAAIALLGLLYVITRSELSAFKNIIWLILPYILLVGFNSSVSIIALYPFVFIFVALGIHMLNSQWVNVFPLNPIAKTAGTTLIILAVILTSLYHLDRYFVAWRNAPPTKEIYSIQNYQNLLQ